MLYNVPSKSNKYSNLSNLVNKFIHVFTIQVYKLSVNVDANINVRVNVNVNLTTYVNLTEVILKHRKVNRKQGNDATNLNHPALEHIAEKL